MKRKLSYTLVVALLALFSLSSEASSTHPSAKKVLQLTEKVADWQIETFADHAVYRALPSEKYRKPWHHRRPYHDLDWHAGALYAGMFELTTVSNNTKYMNWLNDMGEKHHWTLHTRMYHADDHAVGQFYLSMGQYYYNASRTYSPTKTQFDEIMASEQGKKWQWFWCDALFMAPPVWARLSKLTGDPKYLEYMDSQYHMTYDILWSEEHDLFFRDRQYLSQTEKNGKPLFWGRGNGWVYGGLALMIPDMPKNWKKRGFYIELFQKMSKKLKEIQRPDGTWSAGLLGEVSDYPNIETSGSAFYVHGLAWGIRNGILDRETYEPVLYKGWEALCGAVNSDGMLGYVQPVGAAPGESWENYTELYGIGAFLAAGAEMYKYLNHFYPEEAPKDNCFDKVFLSNGGWCWYQSPRAIISDKKVIVGGVDGQNGDIRVGVYDLKKDKLEGEVVLDPKFERDDHDTPAFYQTKDGSILAMWAKHSRDKYHYYKFASKDNFLDWGKKESYKHNYNYRSGVSYMNLYYVENQNKLYNFYRDGETFNPTYVTSSDEGKSWGERTHLIQNEVRGRHRPYAIYQQIDKNTIGIAYTDAHPRDWGNSLYYVEFKDGKFYKVDGTEISDIKNGALKTTKGEMLYKGSGVGRKPAGCESVPNSSWNCAIAKDKKGNPSVGYTLYLNNGDHRFRISSWDGKKWHDREIAYAGKALYCWESSYTGLMAFDPTDPRKVYISTNVNPSTGEDLGGRFEIYYAKIDKDDNISNIKWEAVTKDSNFDNIRPVVVGDKRDKVLLWLHGKWDSFTFYDVDVVGNIL